MSLENNLQTFTEFAATWESSLPDIRVDGIISGYKESHRLIDNYPFYFDQNGFFVISADEQGSRQKVYVREIIEKESYLGSAEYQVFKSLENWFAENDKGLILWFSPQHHPYRGHKVIIHEIGTVNKILLNQSIMFESRDEDFLQLIHSFFPNLKNINNLERFRTILIQPQTGFLPEKLISEIAKLDSNLLREKQVIPELELKQKAMQISNLIDKGTNPVLVANEMLRLGLIGEHPVSCPQVGIKPTFSELLTGSLHPEGKSLKCTCPYCRKQVEAKIANGQITCPSCGKSAPYVC